MEWYQARPFAWVVRDLDGPPEIAKQAVDEIERRRTMGEVSAKQESQLIERLLAEQAAPKEPRNSQFTAMMRLLGVGYERGLLNAIQCERFIKTALATRIVVVPSDYGEPPEIRVICDGVGPGTDASIDRATRFKQILWDGVPPLMLAFFPGSPLGVAAHGTLRPPRLKPGPHKLDITLETTVSVANPKVRPVTREDRYAATFDVPPPPSPVTWQPAVYPSLARLSVTPGRFTRKDVGDQIFISGSVCVTKQPENLAYNAFALIGKDPYPLGTVRVPGGTSDSIKLEGFLPRLYDGAFEITLVLQHSEHVAWAGKPTFTTALGDTLRYGGVRVEPVSAEVK